MSSIGGWLWRVVRALSTVMSWRRAVERPLAELGIDIPDPSGWSEWPVVGAAATITPEPEPMPQTIRLSADGKRRLEKEEARRQHVYADLSGYPTVGVGHKLTDAENASRELYINGRLVPLGPGLTEQQIDDLLAQDIRPRELAIERLATRSAILLTQPQIDALFSFTYNCGVGALAKLWERIERGNPKEIWDYWNLYSHSKGEVVPGLAKRRKRELALFESDQSSRTV